MDGDRVLKRSPWRPRFVDSRFSRLPRSSDRTGRSHAV